MTGSWRLRGYAIERLLGRGASSEVWRAKVSGSGDAVALKRLFLSDAEQARRAHAEAALLTVLDHPNLVRVHALVPADDSAVLVLDLADGGSLAELLATRGRLTPGEVITAVALLTPAGAMRTRTVVTRVSFIRLTAAAIDAYVQSGEGRGKAGGYAIQGRADMFVAALNGGWSNVVGLPLAQTMALLAGGA